MMMTALKKKHLVALVTGLIFPSVEQEGISPDVHAIRGEDIRVYLRPFSG